MHKIISYYASWNPHTKSGQINIRVASQNQPEKPLVFNDPASFSAVLQILQGDDDPYLAENGSIVTGPEKPG